MTAIPAIRTRLNSKTIGWGLAVGVGLAFLVLAIRPYYQQFNYTFLIATAILDGHLGLATGPSWLNELVPMRGQFYSVFPLGAVLSVLPFSLLVRLRLLGQYPTAWVVALLAGGCTGAAYWYTYARRDLTQPKRVLLALWLVGGTWFMTNLLFSGAWQIALGFAVVGELAALVFTVVRPQPVLAGLGFPSLLVTAPNYYFWRRYWRGCLSPPTCHSGGAPATGSRSPASSKPSAPSPLSWGWLHRGITMLALDRG
jgi:hypothetical protein